jgi:hypothetical protein
MRIGNFRAYLIVAIFSLVYGTLRFSRTLQAAHILDGRDRVDLAALHLQGEFVESNLGAVRYQNKTTWKCGRLIHQASLFCTQN